MSTNKVVKISRGSRAKFLELLSKLSWGDTVRWYEERHGFWSSDFRVEASDWRLLDLFVRVDQEW